MIEVNNIVLSKLTKLQLINIIHDYQDKEYDKQIFVNELSKNKIYIKGMYDAMDALPENDFEGAFSIGAIIKDIKLKFNIE